MTLSRGGVLELVGRAFWATFMLDWHIFPYSFPTCLTFSEANGLREPVPPELKENLEYFEVPSASKCVCFIAT